MSKGEESGIVFDGNESRCVRASIVRSRRKEQADQVQLSLTTIDDSDFVIFRKMLHTGDYLILLKHKEKLLYDCIGIKAADETKGEYHLSVLNNKFYKLPTNTKVDIKKLIEIKDSKIEKRDFTIQELGSILFEMYSNAEDKMQVASIHIFGIKYGKNIIDKENINCDFKYQNSYVYTTKNSELNSIKKEYNALSSLCYNCELVTKTGLPFDIVAAICFKNQAEFHPVKYLSNLCRCIIKRKGKIYTNTTAIDVKMEDSNYTTYANMHKIKSKFVIIATHYPFINFPRILFY